MCESSAADCNCFRFAVVLAQSKSDAAIEAVVIGVSTGGPNALADVIPMLPANLPVPIFIVQHMPPVFTRLLADRLNQKSKMTVKEAVEGEVAEAGTIYIAPGDFHMTLVQSHSELRIGLNQHVPENSCRPAVDVLFRSAATIYGAGLLGVVLTGMGQDGQRGAQAIREAGGSVFVQDEKTSVVWGMPGAVVRAGLADQMVPLNKVADEISNRVRLSRLKAKRMGVGASK